MADPGGHPSWLKRIATLSIFSDDQSMAVRVISTVFVRFSRILDGYCVLG